MLNGAYTLWDFECEPSVPMLAHYKPVFQTSDIAVVILPGGGYIERSPLEGEGYAEFLSSHGITAFVVSYRVSPNHFPDPLLDVRRAMRMVRARAEEFSINPDKIFLMGTSAGGHLAAMLANYHEALPGEEKDDLRHISYLPKGHILCYPVIRLTEDFGHVESGQNLLADQYNAMAEALNVDTLVTKDTSPAFVWATSQDAVVPCQNSLAYINALTQHNVPAELHIYPYGNHGVHLATEDNPIHHYASAWRESLLKWLYLMNE